MFKTTEFYLYLLFISIFLVETRDSWTLRLFTHGNKSTATNSHMQDSLKHQQFKPARESAFTAANVGAQDSSQLQNAKPISDTKFTAVDSSGADPLNIRQFKPTTLGQTPFKFTQLDDRAFTLFKPSHTPNAPLFVPLTSYWNTINDNYLATPLSEKQFNHRTSVALRQEGYILNQKQSGTRALEVHYNPLTKDYMVLSSSRTKSYATKNGYVFKTILGYVFEQPVEGSYPLYLFYNDDRRDFALFATKRGIWDAFKCDYTFISIEGFIPMNVEPVHISTSKE